MKCSWIIQHPLPQINEKRRTKWCNRATSRVIEHCPSACNTCITSNNSNGQHEHSRYKCQDNPYFTFTIGNDKSVECNWIVENGISDQQKENRLSTWCDGYNSNVLTYCPTSCGICNDNNNNNNKYTFNQCRDNPHFRWKIFDDFIQGCDWILEGETEEDNTRMNRWCHQQHLDHKRNECPKTCNLCSNVGTTTPTKSPTLVPSFGPTTSHPSRKASFSPTISTTLTPSSFPSVIPTPSPSVTPSSSPSLIPTLSPSINPSTYPTVLPSIHPSFSPTSMPTIDHSSTPSDKLHTISPSPPPVTATTSSPTHKNSLSPSIINNLTSKPSNEKKNLNCVENNNTASSSIDIKIKFTISDGSMISVDDMNGYMCQTSLSRRRRRTKRILQTMEQRDDGDNESESIQIVSTVIDNLEKDDQGKICMITK